MLRDDKEVCLCHPDIRRDLTQSIILISYLLKLLTLHHKVIFLDPSMLRDDKEGVFVIPTLGGISHHSADHPTQLLIEIRRSRFF
jgi:hypothetical protein